MGIILALVTLQAFTTGTLIYFNKRYKGEDLFLSLLFGVIFIHSFYKGAILWIFDDEVIFENLHGAFSLLYGPMLFFYIQSVLGKSLSSKAFILHTLPFLLGFGVNILLTVSVWMGVAYQDFMGIYHVYILYSLLFSSIGYGLYPFLVFRGLAFNPVLRLKCRISQVIGLSYLALFALIVGGFLIELFAIPISLGSRYTFYALMLLMFFVVVNIRMRLLSTANRDNPNAATGLEIHPKEKYRNSRLDEEEQDEVVALIGVFFSDKKPFLDPEFNLDDLARELSLPKLKITQALNLRLGQNFYQYVNTARIEESKKLLRKSDEDNLTVVGYESGFKSKSTFYKYFKEQTGCSPSDYRKSLELVS